MARDYNESKWLVLEFLLERESATSREVAQLLGVTQDGAASYLLKLHRQDLLGRLRTPGTFPPKRKVYYLKQKGQDRLDWLIDQEGLLRPRWVDDEDEVNETEAGSSVEEPAPEDNEWSDSDDPFKANWVDDPPILPKWN